MSNSSRCIPCDKSYIIVMYFGICVKFKYSQDVLMREMFTVDVNQQCNKYEREKKRERERER